MIQKSQFTEALYLLFYAEIMLHKPISQCNSVTVHLKNKMDLMKFLCFSHIYNVLCITGTVVLHLKGQSCGVLSYKSHKALSLYIIYVGWWESHFINKIFLTVPNNDHSSRKAKNWIKLLKLMKKKNHCSITTSVNASIKVNGMRDC